MFTWIGQRCGHGLIPDRGPNCGRRSVQTRICPHVDAKIAARQEVAARPIAFHYENRFICQTALRAEAFSIQVPLVATACLFYEEVSRSRPRFVVVLA